MNRTTISRADGRTEEPGAPVRVPRPIFGALASLLVAVALSFAMLPTTGVEHAAAASATPSPFPSAPQTILTCDLECLKTSVSTSAIRAPYKFVLRNALDSVSTYVRINTVYGNQAVCVMLNHFKVLVGIYSAVPPGIIPAPTGAGWIATAQSIRLSRGCRP